jgi:hypothetical protein
MAGKVNVPVTVALQGLANTQKQLSNLTRGIQGVGKTAGLAAIGFAAFAGGVKAADFAMQAISGARDLERNLLGVKAVFEDLTPRMTEFARTAGDMGLGMTDAAKATTFIGSVLKQSGFAIGETADLTERLVGLATDLSITYGYDVQEALMGMTALFRGEYDPIEKFGVAMKQSEINSELAAKGLGHLEGAQRRFAEQQIRVELLFQRSVDAQGAMERGAGTLAVEQVKLAASFENLRDSVAVSMLPVLGGIFADLQVSMRDLQKPLTEAFEAAAPAVERLAEALLPLLKDGLLAAIEAVTELMGLIERILTPSTEIGEAFTAISENVESLFRTITGGTAPAVDAWGLIEWAITFVANAIADVIRFIDITAIGLKTLGEMAVAFFTGDWSKLVNTDWGYQIRQQIELRDQLVASGIAMAILYDNAKQSLKEIGDQTEVWNRPKMVKPVEPPPVVDKGDGGKAAKDYVKEFFEKLKDEMAQQKARLRLENLGLSEGLIEDILGGQGWQKVFNRVIASGSAGLKKLQADFNRTKAGIAELEKKRKEAADDASEAIKAAQDAADKLTEAFNNAKEAAEEFAKGMREISNIEILPTLEEDLGRFEDAAVSSFRNIANELRSGLGAGRILQADFDALNEYIKTEEAGLRSNARIRDELANRHELASELISEYRQAFTAGLGLVAILDKAESAGEKRTVTETSKGLSIIGKNMREFGVTVTRTFEETIGKIENKTDAILGGFRDLASKARTFAENLRALRKLELDPKLFAQLVEAGVEAGGATAQALVDGGQATVTELNSLFKEIDEVGGKLGEEVATNLYGKGIDLANGLLAGIRSRQSEFELAAKAMALAFSNAFKADLDIALAKPVDAAKAVADSAQANVPTLNQINLDSLSAINGLIERANKWLGMTKNEAEKQRTTDIIGIYEGLRSDILAGRNINLGGIRSGMSVGELQTAARAAGGSQVVNNYDVTVNANTISGGVQAGQAFVEELKSFERNNGSVSTFLVSGLA